MAATLRLREGALIEHRTRAGYTTDTALADAMGIDYTTLYRVLKGARPGNRFVASMVAAFPGLGLDDLFVVVPDADEVAA